MAKELRVPAEAHGQIQYHRYAIFTKHADMVLIPLEKTVNGIPTTQTQAGYLYVNTKLLFQLFQKCMHDCVRFHSSSHLDKETSFMFHFFSLFFFFYYYM